MSAYPDNVIVLADRRREREAELAYEQEWEDQPIVRPHLRLVRSGEPAQRFSLEVFLRRAQIVLAEQAGDTEAHPIGA